MKLHSAFKSNDDTTWTERPRALAVAASVALGEPVDAALRALAAAITTYQELLEKVRASHPKPETDLRDANGLARIYHDLGSLHRRAGHASEADMLDQQRLDLWRYWDRTLPDNSFVQRQLAAASTH